MGRVPGRQDRLARLRQRAQGPVRGPGQQGRQHQDGVRHPRGGAEKTFDRDLWEGGAVQGLASQGDVQALVGGGKPAVLTVYAPWCQFCQGMEADYEKLAEELSIPVAKFRGDEERDFVSANLNTESFPTVNV